MVVILDDIHRGDEPSLLVLRHVANQIADARLLVFATFRDVEPANTLARALPDLLLVAQLDRTGAQSDALSPREAEVATLVAEGLTNRQIADRLFISERTAQNHVQHILTKARYVGTTDGKLRVVTLWESKAHADRFFAETLGPVLARALGPEPVGRPEVYGIDVARSYVREPVA